MSWAEEIECYTASQCKNQVYVVEILSTERTKEFPLSELHFNIQTELRVEEY